MTARRLPFSHRFRSSGAWVGLGVILATSPAGAALTLSAEAATDLDSAVFADNLGNPVDVAELPDGRVVIIEKGGNVKVFTPGADDPVLSTIAISAPAKSQNEQGLLGVVADPDFATNQFVYFYASVSDDENNRHNVLRFKLGADGKITDRKTVIDMGLMGPANHNGGGLTIYGGNLFVGVGDTGKNNGTPHNHFSSCLNKANGKVLRVSLAEASLGQPPADNPLVNVAMVTGCDSTSSMDEAPFVMRAPEKRVYAWGFRNPFRLWADSTTGKLWVGDVGEEKQEEIDVVEKGKHYGYPFFEGLQDYTKAEQPFQPDGLCMGMTPPSSCVPPVTKYDHDGAKSVTGGRILDGCGWPAVWKSRYIYGDHEAGGKVWSVDVNATRDGVVANSAKEFATTNGVTAMKMGTDNALYIVERGAGSVSRITAKAAPAATPGSCLTTNPAPSDGAGGGSAGGASSGGAAGSGSAGQATGGGPGTGGTNSAGGNAASAGNNSGAGTSSSSAGNSAAAGATSGGNSKDSGGCGCRVASSPGMSALGFGALAIGAGLAFGRRRRRRA